MHSVSSPEGNTGPQPTSWTLEEAISLLENVAFVPKSKRHTDVADIAKTIASLAYASGIPAVLLDKLISIIATSNHLDQTTITTLIKNLYPSQRVQSEIVARIVCSLGATKLKPSLPTQGSLLRWLILVYDGLEDQSYLTKLYAVLFDNLDMISLRRSLCYLLAMITRRKHVKPFRIQALMELIRNTGDEERELLGLLRVFKSYYAEIIVGDVLFARRRATYFFKHPDLEWTEHMQKLQEKAIKAETKPGFQPFQVVRREGVKRSRIEVVIPVVQTSKVHNGYASLEEIRSAKAFVRKLDKIQLPNQVASALGDPLVQRYLLLVRKNLATRRMESWLANFFEDELDGLDSVDAHTPGHLGYVLDLLVGYARFTKELPRAVIRFLQSYLLSWNGMAYRESILALLEYLPIQEYDAFYRQYLIHVEAALLNDSGLGRVSLLRYYTNIIRHWSVFGRVDVETNTIPPFAELIVRAQTLCLTMLETPADAWEGDNSITLSMSLAVLQFYAELSQLAEQATANTEIPMIIPSPQTIYLLTFVPVACNLSLLGSILARYKGALEVLNRDARSDRVPKDEITRFNGYVLDSCNLLWRNRALNSSELNALGCLVPEGIVTILTKYTQELNRYLSSFNGRYKPKFKLVSMFSLSHNLALCRISAACVKQLEDEAEKEGQGLSASLPLPVTQEVLARLEKNGGITLTWQDFKLKALDWLDKQGSKGISELMKSAMINLRKA